MEGGKGGTSAAEGVNASLASLFDDTYRKKIVESLQNQVVKDIA